MISCQAPFVQFLLNLVCVAKPIKISIFKQVNLITFYVIYYVYGRSKNNRCGTDFAASSRAVCSVRHEGVSAH